MAQDVLDAVRAQMTADDDPLAGLRIVSHARASLEGPQQRLQIARALDRVADQIWVKAPDYWQCDPVLFVEDSGIVLAYMGTEPIGFVVYERKWLPFGLALAVKGLNIIPAHQSRGVLLRLCRQIVSDEVRAGTATYIAARTRNPVILAMCNRLCAEVVPTFGAGAAHEHLIPLALEAAAAAYPGAPPEVPSLIMRGAYAGVRYLNPQHHRDERFNELVYANQQFGADDAFFIFGRFHPEHNVLL